MRRKEEEEEKEEEWNEKEQQLQKQCRQPAPSIYEWVETRAKEENVWHQKNFFKQDFIKQVSPENVLEN